MKLLDCTLRDGGYYTNWDFSDEIINTYIKSFNTLPVEYLEIGYRSKELDGYLGKFYYCPLNILKHFKELSNKKLVIILNEKDINSNDIQSLLEPIIPFVDLIRIAVDPINFTRALKLANAVKNLGFEVAFNVMYMSTWKENLQFLNQIKNVTGLVDYFYMVDSFGGVYPLDVIETVDMIRSRTDVKLGFHGHNNLEMALSNTLTAIDQGVDIVDSTITGMGRGAGNLKTELLLTSLDSKGLVDFPYNDLSKVVDVFSKLQEDYKWGTNLPYMVSGSNSLPQKQVMEWVGKRYYSFNSIIRALQNQSKGLEDNQKLPSLNFAKEKEYKEALVIGGGHSSIEHIEAIHAFLKTNQDIVVIHASSKNAMAFSQIKNDQFFCLVGNEGHRLETVFKDKNMKGKCILPPYPRTMGTYIPTKLNNVAFELERVDFTDKFKDSHTALALQSCKELNIDLIYVVGYDGYQGDISKKEQELYLENEYLFDKINSIHENISSLTPSKYSSLKTKSIYALI